MFLPLLISLLLTSLFARAENLPYVEHHDPMVIDAQLSLPQLVDLTLEKYPDAQWLLSLENEANAIKQRGDSWTSAASQAFYRFQIA